MSGSRKISLRKVAQAAGVSPTTASRVFSGSDIPTEDTRQHVLETANSMGYTPDETGQGAYNNIAERLKDFQALRPRAKTHFIGLLAPAHSDADFHYDNPHYGAALQGIQQELDKSGYHVVLQPVSDINTVPALINERKIDGALLWGFEYASPVVEHICLEIPTVLIESDKPYQRSDSIMLNSGLAMTRQLEYLWSLGHRRIAYFEQAKDPAPQRYRRRAFKEFFENKNIPLPLPALNTPQNISRQTNDAVLDNFAQQIIHTTVLPTALIAASHYALGLMGRLQRSGVKVPQDMSVIAVNDDWFGGHLAHPAITAYHMPMRELGQAAARMLVERIDSPTLPCRHVFIDGQPIERASCAAVDNQHSRSGLTPTTIERASHAEMDNKQLCKTEASSLPELAAKT